MSSKRVGAWRLGPVSVSLYLRQGINAEFTTGRNEGECPRITLGADYEYWHEIVNCLLHESMEMTYTLLDVRYVSSLDYASDNGHNFFAMDHTKMSEACGWVGGYLAFALPELSKAWKQWRRDHAKA